MSSGNLLFLLVLILGPVVRISSPNWVICWVGLELRFLGAIPLLLSDTNYISLRKESVIKYFCIQALGRGILMLGGIIYYINPGIFWISEFLFLFSLFVKLGVFPIHFWVPGVTVGLNWVPIFILLGWQKIAPFAFIINILERRRWCRRVVLLSGGLRALIGSIIGLNQTSIRAILGSSSIVHTGWGCIGSVFGSLWTYFSIYCLSFFILVILFILGQNTLVGFGILRLRGLPPFIIFSGKWIVLKRVLFRGSRVIFLILPIVGALFRLFFYLKFFYSFYLRSRLEVKNNKFIGFSSFAFITLTGVLLVFSF